MTDSVNRVEEPADSHLEDSLPDDPALPEQVRIRTDKRDRLRGEGTDPYPVGYPRTVSLAEVRARFGSLEADSRTGERVGVTGRVVLNRPT